MAGHSKWAQIKHQKGVTDQKRGKLFSKLLKAITIAARGDANPQFNVRLRSAIEKAKENQVPAENIERAIKRASEAGENLEELIIEAYGPGGIAILLVAASDSKNRTISEIKKIVGDHGGKWAEPGSVRWAFEFEGDGWRAKFPQPADKYKNALDALVGSLEEHDDVQKVYTNAAS